MSEVGYYDYHLLLSRQFEQLTATVVQEKYQIPLLSFTAGRDGGRDAAARGVSIRLGRGKMLSGQNIVVQAKHTKTRAAKMDNTVRNRVFRKEVKKVEQLIKAGEVDIYMVVTNYSMPAGQEIKITQMFREVGCQAVVVIGRETLSRWIQESKVLSKLVPKVYGIGGATLREVAVYTAKGIKKLRSDIQIILEKVDEKRGGKEERYYDMARAQVAQLKHIKDIRTNTESLLNSMEGLKRKLSYNTSMTARLVAQTSSKPSKDSNKKGGISEDSLLQLTSHHGLLREYRFVARTLGLSEADLEEIKSEFPSLKEQVYQSLILWSKRTAEEDQKGLLMSALRRWNLCAALKEIQDMPDEAGTT